MNQLLERAQQISGWMTDDELGWLAGEARGCRLVLEVGAWKGRSTLALASQVNGLVYAIDHWRGSDPAHLEEIDSRGADCIYEDFKANLWSLIERSVVVPLRMDSQEAAQQFAPQSVDLAFIDASHTYEDCRRDIATYRALIRPGGVLAGHDYGNPEHPGVKQAVDEAFPSVQRAAFSIWWVRL